jgi:hypothetical protein
VATWRAVRDAVAAARWLVTPHADRQARADRRIAALTGAAATAPQGVSVPWLVVALAGFAVWLGGCVYFARHALDADEHLVRRAAASAGALVLAGMLTWIIGLHNA